MDDQEDRGLGSTTVLRLRVLRPSRSGGSTSETLQTPSFDESFKLEENFSFIGGTEVIKQKLRHFH